MATCRIDIHADDYGESLHTSADLLECLEAGKLDSISILSNMRCFGACVDMYRNAQERFAAQPRLSVHINIMEGRCLADPGRVPDLVDADGHFCVSWGSLFLRSFLPGKKRLKTQLKEEMALQIQAVREAFPEIKKLRIDSHQHTHMIPVAADALLETLAEKGWPTEYIRNAKEPIWPYLREVSLWKTYRPVNFVKNLILNFCSVLLEGRLQKLHIEPMYLWGLVMSGRMDKERVEKLLPAMCKKAQKAGRTLEILFHPGKLLPGELSEEFCQKEAVAFYVSDDRNVEKDAVMQFAGLPKSQE